MTTETPLLITCPRCRHTWMPRVSAPVKCPICQYKLQIKKESSSEAWEKLEKGYNDGFKKGGDIPNVYCPPVFPSKDESRNRHKTVRRNEKDDNE